MNAEDSLLRTLSQRFGLAPRPNWTQDLERAANAIAGDDDLALARLAELADSDGRTLTELAGHLTVSESYFLRHHEQLSFVVEDLRQALSSGRRLRVWSAGCAAGEEPYSVAILLRRELGQTLAQRVEILGTDLDSQAIANAGEGVYSDWAFRRAPEWLRTEYFEKLPDNRWKVSDAIRHSVDFKALAIQEHARLLLPGSLDVILFRNVAIYLEPDALSDIYQTLAGLLREDGCLVVAPADPRPTGPLFHRIETGESSIYRTSEGPLKDPEPAKTLGEQPLVTPTTNHQEHLQKPSVVNPATDVLPPPATPQASTVLAESLADRGNLVKAWTLACELVEADPSSAPGYLLRGRVALALSRMDEAVADLRRVTFLDAGHRLGRYWYATALAGTGAHSTAIRQLDELLRQLQRLAPGATLEDNRTAASELSAGASFLLESLK